MSQGDVDVVSILGYSQTLQTAYIQVAYPTPLERTVMALPAQCNFPAPAIDAVSVASLSPIHLLGGYYTASFSSTADYTVLGYYGNGEYSEVPTFTLMNSSKES